MNWNPLIGHKRPLPIDAIRVSTLIHQLGEPAEGDVVRRIDGEDELQALDHLLRCPSGLAFLLVDQFDRRPELADQRGAGARQVRQVLINERQQHLPARRRRAWQTRQAGRPRIAHHEFPVPRWQRYDDVLAFLGARDLVRVSLREIEGSPRLSYGLTARGAEWLEGEVYPKDPTSTLYVQLCGVIAELLPELDGMAWTDRFAEVRGNLDEFLHDEQLPPEQDPLSELFYHVFQERL